MSSFWMVKNGTACENIGKPLSFGNIFFAVGYSDTEYFAAYCLGVVTTTVVAASSLVHIFAKL